MEAAEGDSGVGKREAFSKDLRGRAEVAWWVEQGCQRMKQRNEKEAWINGPIEAGSETIGSATEAVRHTELGGVECVRIRGSDSRIEQKVTVVPQRQCG